MNELDAKKRAVVLAPDDLVARFALAEALFAEGRFADAARQCAKVLAQDAAHANAQRLLAKTQGHAGQRPDTSQPTVWWDAAERFVEAGRYDDAILFGEAWCRRNQNEVDRWVELAGWCRKAHYPQRARLAFGRALALSQRAPPILEERDRLLRELGDDDSLDLLSEAPVGNLSRALELLIDGDVAGARRALALCTEAEQQTGFFYRIRAELLQVDGELARAESALARALKYDERPYVAGRLARALEPRTPGRIGVLGWTPFGGAVSPLEAVAAAGQGTLKFTGNVGETGREAGLVAYTCLKALGSALGIDALLAAFDLHLHFTDIQMGKEGQSSGLALTLAGLSAFRRKPLVPRLGATGSITLHGEVQRIEGLYEKAVAARLFGLRRVLYPRGNSAEVRELPALVRDQVEFVAVDSLDSALKHAFPS